MTSYCSAIEEKSYLASVTAIFLNVTAASLLSQAIAYNNEFLFLWPRFKFLQG